MSVGIDAEHAAEFEPTLVPAPVEVQPVRIRVDLNRDIVTGTGLQDGIDVDLVAFSPQQQSAGHVAEYGRERVCDRAEYALGLLGSSQLEPGMDAGDHEVEAAQDLVRVVERPV